MSVLPWREKIWLICLVLHEQFTIVFLKFLLHPGHRKGPEGNAYPAIDLPVHGEPDGVTCILVSDCIHKLWLVKYAPVVHFPYTTIHFSVFYYFVTLKVLSF